MLKQTFGSVFKEPKGKGDITPLQAEFLFGLRAGFIMKFVYLASIVIGSIGGAQVIWNFLDLAMAAILIPNAIALLLLSGEVKNLKNEFFTSEEYYKKDIKKKSAS
ncbi:hypothetical protein BA724_13820 [Domibacillus iocasae]|uniref:Sodium:alanine symporter n=1 Tax=Domibacillus iocasae TaxID=1714016 RepID=A0A1E7DK74_9BACI|nr:hypothetical protein BA724_13820 [Domibacillus iocasae]